MQQSKDYKLGTINSGDLTGVDIYLPRQFISGRTTILAETGKGKTYVGKVLAEEALLDGQQVVVVDPTGVWHGLRSGADGKAESGLPVYVIGGDNGDIPLERPDMAVELADLIIAFKLSVVIDLSHLETQSDVTKFATLFAERLYRKHTGEPLLLIVDEADEFVPQKPNGVGENTMVNRWLRFWKRGRARGFGVLALTQRAASFSKEAITQSGTLILLGMTAKDDINAVIERVQVKAEGQLITDIKKWLPIANVGDAILWSPGALRRTEWFRARPLHTFDSSSTPEVGGKARKATAKKRELPDIEKIKKALKLIKPAEMEFEAQMQCEPQVVTEQVEVRVRYLEPEDLEKLDSFTELIDTLREERDNAITAVTESNERLSEAVSGLSRLMTEIKERNEAEGRSTGLVGMGINRLFPPKDNKPVDVKVLNIGDPKAATAARDASERNFKPGTPIQIAQGDHKHRILGVLATFEALQTAEVERDTVAALAGIGLKSSAYDKHLAELRATGLINSNSGKLSLTPEGRQAAPPPQKIGGINQYHDAWRSVLTKDKRAGKAAVDVLDALVSEGRKMRFTRETLAAISGRSITSSAFENGISSLVRYGLASKPAPGEVQATDKLYPPTLTRRT